MRQGKGSRKAHNGAEAGTGQAGGRRRGEVGKGAEKAALRTEQADTEYLRGQGAGEDTGTPLC